MSRLIFDISLKIFGCVAFVYIHDHNRSKLDPQSLKCVFVGYSPTQKGTNHVLIISHFFFMNIDVTFVESQSFFDTTSL